MPIRRKPRRNYNGEALKRALQSINNCGMTVYKASKVFQIPDQTLRDHINYNINSRRGSAQVLTSTKDAVVIKWINHMVKLGFPVTKKQLLYSLERNNISNNFNNGVSVGQFYEGFFKRHPNIRYKVCEILKISRVGATEQKIRKWFKNAHKYFEDNNCLDVLEDPSRIFTCDESAFYICSKGEAALVRKGKAKSLESENDDKECLTLSLGASADGKLMPIVAIFHSNQILNIDPQKYPETWNIDQSCNGQMTCETFYKYITQEFNSFLLKENIKKPVVLFLDRQTTHLSLPLYKFCEENGIIIMALLPILTHLHAHISVYQNLRCSWRTSVHNWNIANKAQKLKVEDFGPILDDCIRKTLQSSSIIEGFLLAGLYPFNENVIDYSNFINTTQPEDTEYSDADVNTPLYKEINLVENSQNINPQDSSALQNWTQQNRPYSMQFLRQLENRLGAEKLALFKNCSGIWKGDVKDTNLYYFWRRISRQSVQPNNCTILQIFQKLIKDHL